MQSFFCLNCILGYFQSICLLFFLQFCFCLSASSANLYWRSFSPDTQHAKRPPLASQFENISFTTIQYNENILLLKCKMQNALNMTSSHDDNNNNSNRNESNDNNRSHNSNNGSNNNNNNNVSNDDDNRSNNNWSKDNELSDNRSNDNYVYPNEKVLELWQLFIPLLGRTWQVHLV